MNALFLSMMLAAPAAPMMEPDSWFAVAGIQRHQMVLPEGTVSVYLPVDLMGGDRFSGSVFVESGADMPKMARLKLRVGGATVGVSGQGFSGRVASDAAGLDLALVGDDGAEVKTVRVSLVGGARAPRSYQINPVTHRGGTLWVAGPFDGDRTNTSARVNGQALGVLTESPRGATFSVTSLPVGRHAATVREGFADGVAGDFNVVELTCRTERLGRGKGLLRYEIEGLDGLPESAYPLQLTLRSETVQLLEMGLDRKPSSSLNVPFSEVKDGRWAGGFPVYLRRGGTWRLSHYIYSKAFPM